MKRQRGPTGAIENEVVVELKARLAGANSRPLHRGASPGSAKNAGLFARLERALAQAALFWIPTKACQDLATWYRNQT